MPRNHNNYKAAMTMAAAAPPTTHCALAVIIGIPPVEVAEPEAEPAADPEAEPEADFEAEAEAPDAEPVVLAGPAVMVTGTPVKTSVYSVPLTVVASMEVRVVDATASSSV